MLRKPLTPPNVNMQIAVVYLHIFLIIYMQLMEAICAHI